MNARTDLSAYTTPSIRLSLLDLVTSVVPYVGLSVLMYALLGDVPYSVVLAIGVLTGGFLLRTFIVFHDCGHGSFFESRTANRWVGRLCALLTFQAFTNWRHDHAVHHGTAGDLDRRGTGDVPTLTVGEYYASSWRARLGYRLFRNPLVMFGVGPIYSLMVMPRLTSFDKRPRNRNSVLLTNVAVAAMVFSICWFVGWQDWLLVQLPMAMIAGTAGVWLFYVQHQFEDVYWESGERWSYSDAALRGSSYLKLPKLLQFFTGNIGLHHVHHLSSKVANYNLQRAHDEVPALQNVPVLTIADSAKCVRLKLIDESSGRLLTFAEARTLVRAPASPPATANV